jgi:GntR family transcriptional regulator
MESTPPPVPAQVTSGAGVPLHRQLFLVLRDEIARGAIPAGDLLPTEPVLCEQFGVSRITVRRALADLVAQGYIERRHGVGSFARQPTRSLPRSAAGSYVDEMRQIDFETEAQVLEFGLRRTPPSIEGQFEFGDECLHIARVRRERRTGEPLVISEVWLPADLAEVVTKDKVREAPLYRVLSDVGIVVERLQHNITAEIAGPRYAQLLDTTIGSALLRIDRVAFVDDLPHHLVSVLLSPSRSRIVVNQPADTQQASEGLAVAHDVRRSDA